VRRLLAVTAAIVLVDSILYAALTPLLPGYADEFHLSKSGAGLLAGAYAAGALIGGLPGGFAAARLGPRTAAVAGLLTVAAASVVFGLAGDPWTLGCARLAQGVGSALSWAGALTWLVTAAPRGRRGELIGSALGAAIVGAMLGPVLGAVAHVVGEAPAFGAVALVSCALAAVSLRLPAPGRQGADFAALGRAATRRDVLGGFWIVMLASLLFGLIAVLVPLELDRLGWGAVAIGAVWLGAAAIEAAMNPFLGRLVDRRGRIFPVRLTLIGATCVSVAFAWADSAAALAALVLLAAVAFGGLFTPGLSLVSEGAEEAGVAQALAFGAMNAAWAVGNLVGPAAGGALARAAGDTTAFLVAAGFCTLTLAAFVRSAAADTAPAYTGTRTP
jgi:MFS family permease